MLAKTRCPWPKGELDIAYHDAEWGMPVTDDRQLFEMLTLEGAQAGLSWSTILRKREGYRKAFVGFDPVKVARFTDKRREKLVLDASIVRHRQKIESVSSNAKVLLAIAKEQGSFAAYCWGWVDGKPIDGARRSMSEVPGKTELSDRISKDLKKRGMKFVGSTIIYAFMQAAGMVNDHTLDCFRHEPCRRAGRRLRL